jgi:hypothetical protein
MAGSPNDLEAIIGIGRCDRRLAPRIRGNNSTRGQRPHVARGTLGGWIACRFSLRPLRGRHRGKLLIGRPEECEPGREAGDQQTCKNADRVPTAGGAGLLFSLRGSAYAFFLGCLRRHLNGDKLCIGTLIRPCAVRSTGLAIVGRLLDANRRAAAGANDIAAHKVVVDFERCTALMARNSHRHGPIPLVWRNLNPAVSCKLSPISIAFLGSRR